MIIARAAFFLSFLFMASFTIDVARLYGPSEGLAAFECAVLVVCGVVTALASLWFVLFWRFKTGGE